MDIRKVIKARLRKTKMTQYRLAQLVGMSRQGVWAYLNGRQDLTAEKVGKVLDALGLEIRPKD